MAVEERDALLAHPHRFDETVAGFIHGSPRFVPFPGSLRVFPRLNRQLEPFRPFRERSVVHAYPRVAEQVVQREVHVARLEAAVTVGDDRLLGSDTLRRIARAQLVAPPPHRGEVQLDEVPLPEMADRPWDVPAPQLRARAAGILIRIARIDDD